MFKTIPISPEQSGTIHLKLKRKMSMRSHYIYERIRPAIVYEAGKLLIDTPLCKKEGVTLNEIWQDQNITVFNADSEGVKLKT
jgi:hypothetical protein